MEKLCLKVISYLDSIFSGIHGNEQKSGTLAVKP